MEIGPPVNDLSKILGEGVENKGLVDADQSAFPQFPGTDRQQQSELLGTVTDSGFKFPEADGFDRFGFKDSAEENPIDTLNQKAGFGFNPERDLNLPTGDELSKPGTDGVSKGGKSSDKEIIGMQQAQINQLRQELETLKAQMAKLLNDQAEAKAQAQVDKQTGNTPAKDPNPGDAPDNSSGGGPFDPLVNNLGSPMRINKPYVDPVLEDNAGASDVLIQTDQAVDPNPAADEEEGGAKRAILSSTDAVTDPNPDVGSLLNRLNGLNNE